ncbi:hypothetical protein UFOVP1017_10 [uncultured Caudovirales phage]|uniref:S-adenosyl-L-methionine-dependent methyltransferase n=1 Tax=uncultured Caudovirales phage TaxID=2100421 RepID=A0A6J5SWI4_9CAUD|nr:hypothetical protein UFOVP511_10 [uncultured Caudovirales phage]CAB4178486.1 hypothetical protein UFOVP1017_10 [uncultured Caudovirales phage]CAB4187816.1 hypothetical protein UFOVP1168_10 [uncultured Caudovirales phage]CAB4219610.1 hypothetical protein UFOVP1617_43 [uncultured Caudovirales phage]
MNATSKHSTPLISRDTPSATSSPELVAGASPSDSRDGPMTDLFGRVVVLVSHGVQRGTRTADSRDLWPAWFKLIAQRTPSVVFGEQVASADGRAWIDRVYYDMEGASYAIGAANIPACSVGTPHIRYRLWFVADSDTRGRGRPKANAPGSNHERNLAPQEQGGRAEFGETGSGLQSPWPPRPSEIGAIPFASDGVSDIVAGRNAVGNAIVPQVAAAFIAAYQEVNQ